MPSTSWVQQHGMKIIAIILWAGFMWSAVSGTVDIDWMATEWYFDGWNGADVPVEAGGAGGIWWFSPSFGLPWWDAYIYTLLRIIVGYGGLGAMVYKAVFKR
jgi:hypothetical protein